MKPKYPKVTARLSGQNGNVFNLIAIVQRALQNGGVSKEEVEAFFEEVTATRSYDEALQTMMRWVRVR